MSNASISIFAFDSHAVRTFTDDATGEPLFVAKDVCAVLDYKDPTTAVRSHCRGVQKLHPILDSLGRTQEVRVLTEADVLRLIVSSNMPEAERFEKWVFEEVLPSIRKTGGYTQPRQPITEATAALSFWDAAVKSLNIAPSGHLGGVRAIATSYGYDALLPHLPVYAIDAPPSTTGAAPTSSMPTASLTTLLDEFDIGVSAVTANKMLANAGMLEAIERPSSKGAVKRFWSVTDAGLKYGKNVVSPSNPRETQPHWYKPTFKELVRTHMVGF